jgi:hypothetical protein
VIVRAAVLAVALVLAAPARGQEGEGSRKWGSFELGAGTYRPNIDSGFTAPGPYRTVFGGGRSAMFRLGLSKALWTRMGTLEVGFRTGFFSKSGHGVFASGANAGQSSADRTSLNIIPTSVTLTYRTDFLPEQYGIPLAPYARVAAERYNWWVTKGSGSWAKSGATNGYSGTLGIALSLNFLDRGLARELDSDIGINQTYLFFDVTKSKVDDFGSKKSWDLSDARLSLSGGLMFAF